MERSVKCTTLILLMLSTAALPQAAVADQQDSSLANAITSGDASIALRARFEFVDQDNITEDATALPTRLRLNYRSGQWNGWSAFGEFDYVSHVLVRDFNTGGGTSPGRTQYPVVADPDGADLNQLYADYVPDDRWKLRFGRQRILLDNQRFVGGVGWRQNEQTYDGLTFTTSAIAKTNLNYSYITYVRRIFGDSSPAGKEKVNTHLVNANVTINDAWSVVPYLHYLDYDNAASAANSTATLGARLAGKFVAGDDTVALVAEFATQSDAANNPVSYDARYLHIDALWTLSGGFSLGLGFESLGGDSSPGGAFRTPLATLHKFQGWADRFLSTPDGGIDDLYLTAKYKLSDWNLTGVYHDFSAETGGGDYGSEIDLSAARSFAKRYGVLVKAAFFSGDTAAFPDTTKFWLQFTASY